jgi:hypothetical protein
MGCCHSEGDAAAAPNILPKADETYPSPTASTPPMHPCRFIEFDEKSIEMRFMMQITVEANRRMNSPFQIDYREHYRQPDPYTMTLLTPKAIDEVEQRLVEALTTGLLHMIVNSSAYSSSNAAQFKNSSMKESQLSPAIIEAALTHIIKHLNEHPQLVAALGTAKIGYHDNGSMLDDVGARIFVIKGTQAGNTIS